MKLQQEKLYSKLTMEDVKSFQNEERKKKEKIRLDKKSYSTYLLRQVKAKTDRRNLEQ